MLFWKVVKSQQNMLSRSLLRVNKVSSPHSPSPFLHLLQTFRSNMDRRSRSQKIRLFCSLLLSLSLFSRLKACRPKLNLVRSRNKSSKEHFTSYVSTSFGDRQKRNPLDRTFFSTSDKTWCEKLKNDTITTKV